MGIVTGFVILAESENETTNKIYDLLKKRNKKDLFVFKKGVYPKDWFVKNSHFSRNGKDKLKIFVEVSARNTFFHIKDEKGKVKLFPYDLETFDQINKIVKDSGETNLYLFPFQVNGGIKKRKPKKLVENWSGKLI